MRPEAPGQHSTSLVHVPGYRRNLDVSDRYRSGGSPRAFRAWPPTLPSPVRPTGGADPDNARRSAPGALTFRPAIGALGVMPDGPDQLAPRGTGDVAGGPVAALTGSESHSPSYGGFVGVCQLMRSNRRRVPNQQYWRRRRINGLVCRLSTAARV